MDKTRYECGNCDYITSSKGKAKQHHELHLNSPLADKLPREKINFWLITEEQPGLLIKKGMVFK